MLSPMGSFAHTAFDTSLGPVALAATDSGVVRCNLPGSDPDALVAERLARQPWLSHRNIA